MLANLKIALENKETRSRMLFLVILGSTLMITVAVLILSLSVAWFSANAEVEASGMTVACVCPESLIISDNAQDILNAVALTDNLQHLTVSDPVSDLEAATHDIAFASGLKRPTSKEDVAVATGVYSGDYENAEKGKNYVDYTVYMGTVGQQMECGGLVACINTNNTYVKCADGEKAVAGTVYYTKDSDDKFEVAGISAGADATGCYTKGFDTKQYPAASIDIYNGVPGSGGVYKGTLCLGDTDGVVTITENPTVIALNTYITVTMRVYFDGALEDGGKTIVRSGHISANELYLGIRFEAALD